MSLKALMNPNKITFGRSEFREKQSCILSQAKGSTVVCITSNTEGEEKCVLDKEYFEKILAQLKAAAETLEITSDPKLFSELLRVSDTIDDDTRLGKLHSFEEAFGGTEEA